MTSPIPCTQQLLRSTTHGSCRHQVCVACHSATTYPKPSHLNWHDPWNPTAEGIGQEMSTVASPEWLVDSSIPKELNVKRTIFFSHMGQEHSFLWLSEIFLSRPACLILGYNCCLKLSIIATCIYRNSGTTFTTSAVGLQLHLHV